MEDLLMVLAGVAGLGLFQVVAWFWGHDSRDGFESFGSLEQGPGHRPTWF